MCEERGVVGVPFFVNIHGTEGGNGAPFPIGISQLVDTYFDFAEKVLANQREFVSQWASAAAKASEAVTEQAHRATQSVTAHTVNGTEAAVDNATETVKVAGEKAVSTARAARNATKA